MGAHIPLWHVIVLVLAAIAMFWVAGKFARRGAPYRNLLIWVFLAVGLVTIFTLGHH